jgi:hypothetical protein
MKNILLILSMIFLFNTPALAFENAWTPVVATTLLENEQSPNYRDILIHHPGTYSEIKVIFGSDSILDRFDTISFFLWGTRVPGLQGDLNAGQEYSAYFKPTKVKFIRMYVCAKQPGQPLQVRVWMR